MEPHVVIITRFSASRLASLLREAGYLVTKRSPEAAGDFGDAEALVVDLKLFDLMQWLDQHGGDDRILIVAPIGTVLKGVTAPTLRGVDVEEDLVSAVDRVVANQRIAAHRKEQIARVAKLVGVGEAGYNPLTNLFGAMAR
jgi:hypothetical protein